MTLTAQELFSIYSPLWAKHPDTRPKRDCVFSLGQHPKHTTNFGWIYMGDDLCGRGGDPVPVVNHLDAAALCRVGVEDWLSKHDDVSQWFIEYLDTDSETSVCVRLTNGGAHAYTGPTLHHALVSAAMAIPGEGE